jgi:hypothetical protein
LERRQAMVYKLSLLRHPWKEWATLLDVDEEPP